MASIYELNGRVPVLQAVPFGLQHVLAMFVANITPIIILANVAGVNAELSAALIQNCMVVAGIGTLVQLYPVWRIGSRLPIVMGISFTFLSLAIAIATTQGMGTLVGAVIVGGLVEGCLGLFPKYWTRLIPQVVAATVVTAIGFSLLPIGANSFAGGQGAADFGSATNWIIGSVTLLTCLLTQVFARGFLRSLSVLVGLAVGYILSVCMGVVDFSGLSHVEVVALPRLMPFKPEFHLDAILAIVCVFLVSATETIGDTSALCSGALGREVEQKEMGGLTTIPQPVLGGCTIMMFGSILFAGFGMMAKTGFSQRNMIIVSLSLSVGLGFTQATGLFAIFPKIVQTVFAENCVAVVFLLAVVLNLVLPKEIEKKA